MALSAGPLSNWSKATWSLATSLVCGLLLAGCSGSGGSATDSAAKAGDADLQAVVIGRLVDVYGLRRSSQVIDLELVQADVVVGPNIQDERQGDSDRRDEEITYDFIGVDPDTLQPRLLITRDVDSADFKAAFEALDARAQRLTPGYFGQDTSTEPYSVAPRNGAIRLDFSRDLGLSQDFFTRRDAQGNNIAFTNPEAIQLLEIRGDPTDGDDTGDFRVIPTRIIYRGRSILLDPVLLGNEGRSLSVPNNARGLPESPDSLRATVRLALAMEGPLSMSGLRERISERLIGKNNSRRKSIIRDFRSANASDDSQYISKGFVRDPVPPRIVGKMVMLLESVNAAGNTITLYKAGLEHEIDRGDIVSLVVDNSGIPVAIAEIVRDPEDDRGSPAAQHVTIAIRSQDPGGFNKFIQYDPSRRPDYPSNPGQLEAWLLVNAPKVVLAAEFTGDKDLHPEYFVDFSPDPLPDPTAASFQPNWNVSPFASAIIRFSKPIDLNSARSADSFILSTLAAAFTGSGGAGATDPVAGTPHLIAARVTDAEGEGSQTSIRTEPIMGFYLDDSMRANIQNYPYYLHVIGGNNGIRDLAGNSVDFRNSLAVQESMSVPFTLDARRNQQGQALFPNNAAVSVVRRFLSRNEDEKETAVGLPSNDDWFGAIVLQDGRATGRPTGRVSKIVDNRNQISSPPSPPFAFCPEGSTHTNIGLTTFSPGLQNPMNPLGCRLQTVWREIDLSLSRTDPADFNLDVEQMHWGPHTAQQITFDEFDRTTLFLGHCERRPSPCVESSSALPAYYNSGLVTTFAQNYLRNLNETSQVLAQNRPEPYAVYRDVIQQVFASSVFYEPSGVNRFIPLPTFRRGPSDNPFFTWRDERVMQQGGGDGENNILSPFQVTATGPNGGYSWDNSWTTPPQLDGKIGAIALPLLADFYYFPDSPDQPVGNPFRATGFNGWQATLTVTSSSTPNWRVYSGGGYQPPGYPNGQRAPVFPDQQSTAIGGRTPQGTATPPGDNTAYWIQVDFLKRISLMTYGFINLEDPHRAASKNYGDPRLGGGTGALSYPRITSQVRPVFDYAFEPPLRDLPAGTRVGVQFRVADKGTKTTDFELEPLKAAAMHIRHQFLTASRQFDWFYVRAISDYTNEIARVQDPAFLAPFYMRPEDVKWLNFRFIFENNVDIAGALPPGIDTFSISYRLQRVQ